MFCLRWFGVSSSTLVLPKRRDCGKENFNDKKQLRRVLVTENVMALSQGWFGLQIKVLSTGLALGCGRRREGGLLCSAHAALRCPCSTRGDSMDSSGSSLLSPGHLPCSAVPSAVLLLQERIKTREFFKVGRRKRGKNGKSGVGRGAVTKAGRERLFSRGSSFHSPCIQPCTCRSQPCGAAP